MAYLRQALQGLLAAAWIALMAGNALAGDESRVKTGHTFRGSAAQGSLSRPTPPKRNSPLSAPAGISANASPDQVSLAWPPVAGAISYEVAWWVIGEPGHDTVRPDNAVTVTVAQPNFEHAPLPAARLLGYQVSALGNCGRRVFRHRRDCSGPQCQCVGTGAIIRVQVPETAVILSDEGPG